MPTIEAILKHHDVLSVDSNTKTKGNWPAEKNVSNQLVIHGTNQFYMWGSNISIYLHVGLQMDPVEKSKDVLSVVSPMF